MSECPLCYENMKRILVHENAGAFTVVSVNPVREGHVMVLPKRHAASFGELGAEELKLLMGEVAFVSSALAKRHKTRGCTLFCGMGNGTQPQHLHLHVYPEIMTKVHLVMGQYYGRDVSVWLPDLEMDQSAAEMRSFLGGALP